MSLPRYQEYKDSDVAWLGEVPKHWDIDRLKNSIISCRNGIWGNEAAGDESDIPCVRVADFDRKKLSVELTDPTIRNVTIKERIGRELRQGDLLLEKSGGGELQPVGFVVLYDDPKPAVCSNFIARMQVAENMDSSFWRYVHAAAYSIRLTTASINQTSGIQNLDQDRYFNERVAFPPLAEQSIIAAFLDRETEKIDALVAEQEKLIALLKEKRQAVISHAVTKGLNPDAKMKDSGIEWLGKVPEHWSIKRLKHIKALTLNAFVDGPFGSNLKSEHFTDAGDVYVIESNFATQGKLIPSELKQISKEHFESIKRSETRAGDIVIAKIGAQFGKAFILPNIDKPAVVSGNTMKLTVDSTKCVTKWAYWQLFNLKENGEIDLLANGSAQPALSLGAMNELIFLVPQINEQNEILTVLDIQLASLNDLTTEAERGIELLKERRSALISAAVTGKIDVRGLEQEGKQTA